MSRFLYQLVHSLKINSEKLTERVTSEVFTTGSYGRNVNTNLKLRSLTEKISFKINQLLQNIYKQIFP